MLTRGVGCECGAADLSLLFSWSIFGDYRRLTSPQLVDNGKNPIKGQCAIPGCQVEITVKKIIKLIFYLTSAC